MESVLANPGEMADVAEESDLDGARRSLCVNWDAVGAIGELVGATAVVVTLLYLARQITNQSRALETTTRDSVFRQLQDYNNVVMGDPRLGGLFQRAMAELEPVGFSADDHARLVHALFGFFKIYENIYVHFLGGSISEEAWSSNREVLFLYASQPGGRAYWEKRRGAFDSRFQRMLDKALLEGEGALLPHEMRGETS